MLCRPFFKEKDSLASCCECSLQTAFSHRPVGKGTVSRCRMLHTQGYSSLKQLLSKSWSMQATKVWSSHPTWDTLQGHFSSRALWRVSQCFVEPLSVSPSSYPTSSQMCFPKALRKGRKWELGMNSIPLGAPSWAGGVIPKDLGQPGLGWYPVNSKDVSGRCQSFVLW